MQENMQFLRSSQIKVPETHTQMAWMLVYLCSAGVAGELVVVSKVCGEASECLKKRLLSCEGLISLTRREASLLALQSRTSFSAENSPQVNVCVPHSQSPRPVEASHTETRSNSY